MSSLPMICIQPKTGPDSRGSRRDLEICIRVAPNKWHSRQPVFCFDEVLRVLEFLGLQKTDARGKFRSRNLPAHGRGSNPHFRIVAKSLGFAGLGGGHNVEVSILFAEPDRCVHGRSVFAEGCQTDITLAADLGGNRGSHPDILNGAGAVSVSTVHPDLYTGALKGRSFCEQFASTSHTIGLLWVLGRLREPR